MSSIMDAGTLALPEGCRSEVRVSIRIPTPKMRMMTTAEVTAAPQLNLVYSRHEAEGSALEALGHIVEMTKSQGVGAKLLKQEELRFDDGQAGVSALLALQVDPQTLLHQKHFMRKDEGVLTHFVLTGPGRGFDKVEGDWSARIRGFRLP